MFSRCLWCVLLFRAVSAQRTNDVAALRFLTPSLETGCQFAPPAFQLVNSEAFDSIIVALPSVFDFDLEACLLGGFSMRRLQGWFDFSLAAPMVAAHVAGGLPVFVLLRHTLVTFQFLSVLAAMLDEFGPVFLLLCWLAKFGVSLIREGIQFVMVFWPDAAALCAAASLKRLITFAAAARTVAALVFFGVPELLLLSAAATVHSFPFSSVLWCCEDVDALVLVESAAVPTDGTLTLGSELSVFMVCIFAVVGALNIWCNLQHAAAAIHVSEGENSQGSSFAAAAAS